MYDFHDPHLVLSLNALVGELDSRTALLLVCLPAPHLCEDMVQGQMHGCRLAIIKNVSNGNISKYWPCGIRWGKCNMLFTLAQIKKLCKCSEWSNYFFFALVWDRSRSQLELKWMLKVCCHHYVLPYNDQNVCFAFNTSHVRWTQVGQRAAM